MNWPNDKRAVVSQLGRRRRSKERERGKVTIYYTTVYTYLTTAPTLIFHSRY